MSDAPPSPPPPEQRLLFPLWAKLSLNLAIGLAMMLGVAAYADMREELERTDRFQRERMLGVATAAAGLLDGDLLASWTRQSDEQTPEYQHTVAALARARDASGMRWIGLYGRKDGRYYYLLDAEDEDAYPLGFPFFDSFEDYDRVWEGETVYTVGHSDEYGRWDSAIAPVRDSSGRVVAALSVDVDADWQQAVVNRRLRQLGARLLAAFTLAIFLGTIASRLLARPLRLLARASRAVAMGDLEQRVSIRSTDEVGVLADAFNGMISGLRDRNRIQEAFGRYVSPEVGRMLLSDPEAMRPGGKIATVTILMSDLRGFTTLSSELGPERLVGVLNTYFERMTAVIQGHGGTINEFIGDAILALFGAPFVRDDDALRASACAVAMQIALAELNAELGKEGLPLLEMGIGLNTGPVMVGNIGSSARIKWGVVGDAVNMAARVESSTVGGEVLLAETTWTLIQGRAEARGPIPVRVKGHAEPLLLFALRRIGPPYSLAVPAEEAPREARAAARAEVSCAPVQSKQIRDELAFSARFVSIGAHSAELESTRVPELMDDLALRGTGDPTPLIYVKVMEREGSRWVVRFTAVPETAEEWLAELTRATG